MYPAAALLKTPTQTVNSSHVFERWILQKQPKIFNKITESWDKNTIKDLEQVCPKQDHDFLSWWLSSETISPRLILSSWSVVSLVRSISQWRKPDKTESFKRFTYIDSDKTFRNLKNLKLHMQPCPVTKQFCLALCTVKSDLCLNGKIEQIHVSSSALKSTRLRTSGHSNFPFLYPINSLKIWHFRSFCKITLYISKNNVGNPLYSEHPPFHTVPCNSLVH